MSLEARLAGVARHEVAHALFASTHDIAVDWVKLHAHGDLHGETAVRFPMAPWQLATRYQSDPRRAREQVQHIVSMVMAPWVLTEATPRPGEGDCEQLEEWRQAWTAVRGTSTPAGVPWVVLHGAACHEVRRWLAAPGRREDLDALSGILAKVRSIRGADWRELVEALQEPRQQPRPARRRTPYYLQTEHLRCTSNWRDYGGTGYIPALVC
jgi:hypothetical protein